MAAPRPLPGPSSCWPCGIGERVHGRQWTEESGWHPWEPPTDEQILARMKTRRAAKTNR
jgi:hypothetical protein